MSKKYSRIKVQDLTIKYGDKAAIKSVSMEINENGVTAFIGPSGCGKSTLLRAFNRMNDEIPTCSMTGEIEWDGKNLLSEDVDPVLLRRAVSMVFQKPNPFPTMSIRDNVLAGLTLTGRREGQTAERVEKALVQAALWDEVKDRLDAPGHVLSGGQQQRLCIARAIAVSPEVILMDEPCSALDPIATAKIEELISELREQYTIVIVTHSMQQAARVSDRTAYFHLGKLIEVGDTKQVFTNPLHALTQDYIPGRFG